MANPAAVPAPIAAIGRATGQSVNGSFHTADGQAVLVDATAAVSARYRCKAIFQLDIHCEHQARLVV